MTLIPVTSPDDPDDPDVPDDRPEQIEVRDPTAIAQLTDLRGLTMLTPFLRRTHTLSSAAREIGRPPSSLAHWIPRFVACGLLERRGQIRRAGAAMPRYRTPAPRLVVPFDLIPFDARVRLLDEGRMRVMRRFLDGIDEAMAEVGTIGLSFAAHPVSGTIIDFSEQEQRGFTDGWFILDLDEDDALTLARELEELLRRYTTRSGRRQYVVHGGVAPTPTFRWRSAPDAR